MSKAITDKGKNLIKTAMIDGQLYARMEKGDEVEIWLKITPPATRKCIRCGYDGVAIDDHHIYGRGNSDETIPLCSNCHRELHAGIWEYRP